MATQIESHSVVNQSIWAATTHMPDCPSLKQDARADVCIVGAGIAGLSTAYLLMKAGKSVIVLDDGPLAGGMTEVTTAHLTNALDDRYFEIERVHGEEGARLAAESHTAAINRIEAIVRIEKIPCDFERIDGYLFLSPGEKEELLERELSAAHRAGLNDVQKLSHVPMSSHDLGPCLRFPNQGQFHPLKYLAGLAHAIERGGGRLFTNSHADKISGGAPAEVKIGGHVVTADHVVVATNCPINDLVAIHTKQAPYMTYVVGLQVPHGTIEKALYWDTGSISQGRPAPYHYIRLQTIKEGADEQEILIVGGEDHKSGQADDTEQRHGRLESWAREHFPLAGPRAFTWAGQVMETFDGLAFLGRNPLDKDNVFIITGDSGMGMTHGTIGGILLTDLILGRENPWAKLYEPSRKTLRAAGQYAREVLNMAAQYTDWLTGGDVDSVEAVANDSGAVIRRGLKKVAVYRDEHGALHECSAVCTHLGGIVHWNAAEKTWDCPCHGSRFDKLGKAINGPANTALSKIERE